MDVQPFYFPFKIHLITFNSFTKCSGFVTERNCNLDLKKQFHPIYITKNLFTIANNTKMSNRYKYSVTSSVSTD